MATTTTSAAQVVHLPTAATERVRQPPYSARWRARRAGLRAGSVSIFPGETLSPQRRAECAEVEAHRELMAAGGITRSGTLMMLTALIASLPEERREILLGKQLSLAEAVPGPESAAALAYVRDLVGAKWDRRKEPNE